MAAAQHNFYPGKSRFITAFVERMCSVLFARVGTPTTRTIRTGRKPCMHIQAAHNAATMCIIGNLASQGNTSSSVESTMASSGEQTARADGDRQWFIV